MPEEEEEDDMASIYITPRLDGYRVDRERPFAELETFEQETEIVQKALQALLDRRIIEHAKYDPQKLVALRQYVAENFEIPWTSVSLRCQHLIYAINAIHQPQVMIAAGVFCGATFINNAGSAVGPGAVYTAKQLIGVEMLPDEAARATRNISKIDPTETAQIVCDDAIQFCKNFRDNINLLYLDIAVMGGKKTNLDDPNNTNRLTKSLYLDALQASYDRLKPGALVLSHNSVDHAEPLTDFLAFVRDPKHFRNSVNVVLDTQGLEVTVK